jgi:hypothetical protein
MLSAPATEYKVPDSFGGTAKGLVANGEAPKLMVQP